MPRGKDKWALVPGCGSVRELLPSLVPYVSVTCSLILNAQGNDVAYLAATLGITSVGVEISPKGLEVAQEYVLPTYAAHK